VVRRY